MQINRMAWSCRIIIAMLLRGLQLDLIIWGLEFLLDQYNYSSVDTAISPTRRRRDHRYDSSSSCDPIASVTDLVLAGATAHHHTKIRTFAAEGFRATSIPENSSICSQYICEQQCLHHDAPDPCPYRRSTVGIAAQQRQMIECRRRRRTSALEVYLKIRRYFWSRTGRIDTLPSRKCKLML